MWLCLCLCSSLSLSFSVPVSVSVSVSVPLETGFGVDVVAETAAEENRVLRERARASKRAIDRQTDR